MNTSYENQICEAIEYIVDHAIARAGFDKTIQATIVSCVDETIGQYKVKYQNSSFHAYANSTEVTYSSGTDVYILVPGNDMSKTKTILGAVDKLGTDFVKTLDVVDSFEITGNNCINSAETFELCSYEEKDVVILYNQADGTDLINLNTVGFEEYIRQSSYIMCGAYFKTQLNTEQRFKGNYGIAFDIAFKSSASDEDVIKNYVIDIDQMTGSPYTFNNFTKQMGTFNIDAENFLYVDKVYIFSYDFPNLKDNQPNDIFVKDIQLCCANEISKEDLETYYLVLNTPEGSYFDGVDEDSKEKPIQAQVKIQGKSIDVESQSVEYYWFRENAKVTNAHVKYCKYGGRGWECLNDYNQIADDLIEWVPSTYEYKIKKSDCRAKETVYKCVAVCGEVVIENSITIKNFGSNYTISIEATDGTDFYFDRGTTSLICLVNGEQETRNYSYVWVENTNLGGYNQLNPTTDLNDAYSNAYNEYYDLLLDIEEERVMAEAVQDELNEKLTILKEYDTIMRVEDNIIYNLDISSISNFSIYKCSVFYNEIYIGTSSVTITNTHEVETGYNLLINDGEKTYQYDENGTSPASSSKVSPLEIKPITFDIYDNLGKSFDKETLEKCSIQWIAPKENTMLVFEEIPTRETENSLIYEDVLELNYSIAPKYDLNKINNTIQLIVTYQGLVLVGTTNIAFTKQGDPGTNGTDYVCRIVPNVAEGADVSAPMLTNGVLNYEPEEDGVWFKVQLWKNAENIFEGNESGSSLEGKRAVINWNVLKNKYTYQISDVSNLNLLDAKKGKFAYQNVAAGRQPANIVECTVEYDGMAYYATLPVLVATAANGYAVELKEDTGFSYVIYSSDGTMPKYDEELPFEINTYKVIDNVKTNVSTLSGDHRVYLNYYINGSVYDIDEEDWVDSIHLEEAYSYREDLQKNQIRLRPTDTFSGHCVNNAVECVITDKDNNDVASIIIPIYFCLNRYGLAALNGWNGNSIAINEDGGFILAPQVGAGKKEEDNSFTGIFMGVVKETGSSKDETGLFAYKSGVRSIFLDAESGNATFGTSEGSQFVITPATAADSNDKKVIAIHDNVKQDDVFYVTKGGDLFIKGDGSELNITANKALIDITDDVGELESRIEAAEGDIELSVRKDNIIQSINLSTENGATINAQKINLKGAVTMSAFDAEVTDKIDSIDEQIVDIEVQYYSSSSKDRLEGGQWGVENPDWQEGRYIWTKNIYYYLDTSIEPGESVPVCITGNTGAAGKPGVGVSEIIEWYLVSSKNEGIIAGEGTWYTTPPEMNATDKYLWNYTEVKYSEDQPASLTEAVIIGVFGKGIESTVEYYLATSRDSGITQDTTGWTTDPTAAKMTAVNKYLWNYEQINYTDDSVVETKPVIIGVYGDKGADGTAIVSITNYYLKSSQSGGVTIEGYTWDTTIPELDANAPYLWNYEVTTFTKGDPTYVEPHVIAIYTQNGVGISEIKEMYAATQDYVEPAKTAFNEDAPILSSINKYLWCYEIITYTDGTSDETIPHVVGVYGDDGKGIATTVVKYADSTNGTQWPTAEAEWETTIPTVAAGNYLWTRTVITYTDGSKSTAYSVSKVGADGEQGRGVQNVVEQYYLSTNNGTTTGGSWSNTCPPWEEGKYYWTRSYITWDDGTSNGTTPVLANGLNDSIAAAQKASQDLADFSESVTGDITELQKQLDGQIETWFYEGAPSSTTLPESEWNAADKKNHVGDLYYDKLTGSCYRYMLDGSIYVWYEIKDTEVATALETAQAAKDTADSKRRVFVTQPIPPYDIGDLWANGTDLYKCKVARTSGNYVSTDWEKATKYTDDTTANNALNKANAKIRQVDVQYALSSAVDQEPSGTGTEVWTTTAPEWTEGKYMWQRTRYYIGDSTTPTYSDATCIAGAKGMGIASSTVEYQVGTSGTTPPTGTWSPTPVTAAEGKYLWTRTTIKYTDSSVDDSISYSVAYQGTKGADAKTVTITSDNGQVFKKAQGATSFTPSTITLTATLTGGLSSYQWYKDGTAMSGKTSATLSIASSAPGVYKCVSGSYSDSMTLVQVTDGTNGTNGADAYTLLLSNENHTFAGGTSAAIAANITTNVIAYKGTTQVAATVGTISGLPTGLTATINNNGTTSTSIKFAATTSLTTTSGQVTIPITVDGKSFTKYFSYSLALKGSTGSTGKGVSAITELFYKSTSSTTVPTLPTSKVTSTSTAANTWTTVCPPWENGYFIWTCSQIEYTSGNPTWTTPMCSAEWTAINDLTIGNRNYLQTNKWIQGNWDLTTGELGAYNGRVAYSEYVEVIPGETYCTQLFLNGLTDKLILCRMYDANKNKVNSIAPMSELYTVPSNVKFLTFTIYDGVTVDDILTGKLKPKFEKGNIPTDWTPAPEDAVSTIDVEYAQSTSPTEAPESGWSTTAPPWESGKYMWSRQVVYYGDGTSTPRNVTCISGATGQTGAAGNGISSTKVQYVLQQSGTTVPTSWSDTFPNSLTQGYYLWTKTTYTYTNGSTKESITAAYQGKNGTNGISITSVKPQFQASANNSTAPTGTWSDTLPEYNSAKPYIWYRQYTTWSSGDPTTSTPTLYDSMNDAMKTAYDAHASMTAWAYINDQTYINGAKIYTGTIGANQIAADSITAAKIAAGAVSTSELAANAITSAKIAAGAVTADKISVTNLSALNAKIGQWSISDGIYSNIPTLNGYLVASSGNLCIAWNDSTTTQYCWVFNSFTRNGDNFSSVNFTDYWSVGDEKTYIVNLYYPTLDANYSTNSRVALGRAVGQKEFTSSEIAEMITFLKQYESTNYILAIHTCLGCDMTSALRAELVKFGGSSSWATWTDNIVWYDYGGGAEPGYGQVNYTSSTIHAYAFIGQAGLAAGSAKEDYATGRMATANVSLPITLSGAGSFTASTTNNMYVGYNGININNNLFLSEDILEFRDKGRFTGSMRVLLPDETYGFYPYDWSDAGSGMDGNILLTSVGRGNYIGWGFYDEYSESYSVLAYLQPDSSDTYNGTDAFGGDFMITGGLYVDGYGGVGSTAGYLTDEMFMGYAFYGNTESEEGSTINGLNWSSYYWTVYDSSWNVKEREGGIMLGDWTYNTFCVSPYFKNWSTSTDRRLVSVRNANNNADLRVNENAGVYHDSQSGSTTAKWLIYISTSGTVTVNTGSDARLKNDLGEMPYEETLTVLRKTPIHNFIYKADEEKIVHNGIIAQELRDILIENNIGMRPYLIIESAEDDNTSTYNDITMPEEEVVYGVDYQKFTPILWSGWKYHDSKIDNLEREISELKQIIKELKGE